LKILVTGGAGYLGSTLIGLLIDEGHSVVVLDNFLHGESTLNHYVAMEDFEPHRGDARDAHVLKDLLTDVNVVIPLAAIVGAPACKADPVAAKTTNADAIALLSRLMSKDQRLIIPITNSGYGVGEPGIECTEDTPMRPISLYGQTKVEAEAHALERENSIALRLATVFGFSPRMRIDLLVNDFVHRAVTDRSVMLFEGHFKRNFIHVRDVARAFVHAIDNFDGMRGRPYNVGLSDANLSKIELCERIKEQMPDFVYLDAPVGEDPDKRDYIVSNARIEATGFRPIISLDRGIAELIRGYRMIRNSRYGNA
jgi:nucleoside-diphosphate-sugar epimerase